MSCDCWSYNGQEGSTPNVELAWPFDSDPHRVDVDACAAPVIQALWDAGHVTAASCCGHGTADPLVLLGEHVTDYAGVHAVIAATDNRTWTVLQWQCVEILQGA